VYTKIAIVFFVLVVGNHSVLAQAKIEDLVTVQDTIIDTSNNIDPLTPAKAAFYSAILPGLGQAYNKKYWKIPLVYAAIGTSLYFYIDSNKNYNAVRDAYKRRLEGYDDDDYSYLSDTSLESAQTLYKKNRDYSAFFMIAFYALNIIDANVDAALLQFNVNENLSIYPNVYPNDVTYKTNVGLTVNFKF
jgi:hypothetical protein